MVLLSSARCRSIKSGNVTFGAICIEISPLVLTCNVDASLTYTDELIHGEVEVRDEHRRC